MKVKINIERLKNTVADLDSIMKGNALPMLDSLLITASSDAIMVTANNLNIMVSKYVLGEVLIDGKALLHHDDLAMLLKMKNDVILEVENNQCVVTGSRLYKFFSGNDADNFPSMPVVPENEPNFTIPESDLLYCLKLKKLTSSDSNYAPRFCGIWIDENNILACDGFRLGKIETKYHAAKKFMLPDFVLNYLAKALEKKSSSPVVFYLSERGYVKARSDSFEIIYRQYEGDFVSYNTMFDLNKAKTAIIRKQDLSNTIGFMCDVYKMSYKGKRRPITPIVFTLTADKLKMTLTAEDKYVEDEIPVEKLSGDVGFQIGFQPLKSYELLSLIDGDEITMSFEKQLSPSIIFGEKENEKYLLLPTNLNKAA